MQPKGIDPSCAVAGAGPSRPAGTCDAPETPGTTLGPWWANFAEIQKTLEKTLWSFLAQCKCVVSPSLGFLG